MRKVTKEAPWEGFSFPEKPGKSAFRFAKSIRDGFNVTFCGVPQAPKSPQGRFNVTFSLVRKSNQKVPQRSADLWTPGERFKTRAVGFQMKFEKFSVLSFFAKVY